MGGLIQNEEVSAVENMTEAIPNTVAQRTSDVSGTAFDLQTVSIFQKQEC
jgi:hypothetical protein